MRGLALKALRGCARRRTNWRGWRGVRLGIGGGLAGEYEGITTGDNRERGSNVVLVAQSAGFVLLVTIRIDSVRRRGRVDEGSATSLIK